jgi:peptidoglycan hydrolase CwlO-like protein
MKVFSLILIAVFLFGCSAKKRNQKNIDKAQLVFNAYPDSFAYQCDLFFPFKDSVAEPVIKYIPADNKNYTKKIDSLTNTVIALNDKLKKDTSNVAKYYKGIVSKLASDIGRLRSSYKPCEPDTFKVTYKTYLESTRKAKVYENQVKDLEAKLASRSEEISKLNKELSESKKLAQNRLFWLIGIILFIALYFIVFRRFL